MPFAVTAIAAFHDQSGGRAIRHSMAGSKETTRQRATMADVSSTASQTFPARRSLVFVAWTPR